MKNIVKYRCLAIPRKLTVELRITIDDRTPGEFISSFDGNKSNNISLFPLISINLTKSSEVDETGVRIKAPWNPNDNLGMTKFSFPIFIEEFNCIKEDMKTPNLYTYHGKRLELNEEVAQKIRRVFVIGNTTLELSAVVLIKPEDESRVEGIKMKFNNEQSSVLLTLNEMTSLLYTLKHIDVDSLSLAMYTNYVSRPDKIKTFDPNTLSLTPQVDIKPKSEFETEEV